MSESGLVVIQARSEHIFDSTQAPVRTRSQITSNLYVSNWKSSYDVNDVMLVMFQFVNNISRIFSVYNRMCIVCPLFEALLGYFFNSIQRRKQTRCSRIRIIRIKHCVFRKLCMHKLQQLTHKLYIKSFSFLRVLRFPPPIKLTNTITEIVLKMALNTTTLTLTHTFAL